MAVSGSRVALLRKSALFRVRRAAVPGQSPALTAILVAACAAAVAVGSTQAASASDRSPGPSEARWRETLGARREMMIQRLHAYWLAGDFVQNPDSGGGPGHFILDARSKPCPLASIIQRSGRGDLVEEAARKNNNVKVVDLRDGPILEWILESGLTQEECVLIQRPSLSGQDRSSIVREAERKRLAGDLARIERILRESTHRSLVISARRMMAAERAKNAERS